MEKSKRKDLYPNSPSMSSLIATLLSEYCVRHSLHWGGSLQDGLRHEQTCGMILASAYVLYRLSAVWLQLQMLGRSPK